MRPGLACRPANQSLCTPPTQVVIFDASTGAIDIEGVGSTAMLSYETLAGDSVVHAVSSVLLPEKGPLADALTTLLGGPIVDAPEGQLVEAPSAAAAANLASAAALAAAVLSAALLM